MRTRLPTMPHDTASRTRVYAPALMPITVRGRVAVATRTRRHSLWAARVPGRPGPSAGQNRAFGVWGAALGLMFLARLAAAACFWLSDAGNLGSSDDDLVQALSRRARAGRACRALSRRRGHGNALSAPRDRPDGVRPDLAGEPAHATFGGEPGRGYRHRSRLRTREKTARPRQR
jgi:hypothetical protein